jgi:hypothetical protein
VSKEKEAGDYQLCDLRTELAGVRWISPLRAEILKSWADTRELMNTV